MIAKHCDRIERSLICSSSKMPKMPFSEEGIIGEEGILARRKFPDPLPLFRSSALPLWHYTQLLAA